MSVAAKDVVTASKCVLYADNQVNFYVHTESREDDITAAHAKVTIEHFLRQRDLE